MGEKIAPRNDTEGGFWLGNSPEGTNPERKLKTEKVRKIGVGGWRNKRNAIGRRNTRGYDLGMKKIQNFQQFINRKNI